MTSAITLAEQKLLPDFIARYGIRQLLKQRLLDECANDVEQQNARQQKLLANLRESPIAIETDAANAQHYEVPTAFYQLALAKHLKYSSCYWEDATENLDQAEVLMLALTTARADLQDGQHILELGCGWGSLTLWMAEHFPHSNITAVSNSNSQREYIQQQAKQRGLWTLKY
jgi:cyclopropane-fatty-acyl-phospholipid synthase